MAIDRDRQASIPRIRPIRGGSDDGPPVHPATARIERDLTEFFASERRTLEEAAARYKAQTAKLLRQDGSRWFADDEHDQRVAKLQAEAEATAAAVRESAEQAVAQAEAELAALEGTDPLAALPEADLARAASRLPFVKEDVERLAPAALAARLRALLLGNDRAEALLTLRYLPDRLGALPTHERAVLEDLGRQLERKLEDPKLKERRSNLERKAEAAKVLHGRAGGIHSVLDPDRDRRQLAASGLYGRL